MDKTSLAKRAKEYQGTYDHRLPVKSYTILQLDGRAFHTYTKGLKRPFDEEFIDKMNQVAVAVLSEVTNAKFAYVQSDEINILLTDFEQEGTQPYFANRINKVVSVASGVASATMSRLYPDKNLAIFDARFFAVPDKNAAWEYFLWRQVDAIKNSVRSVANNTFSHKTLTGVNTTDAKLMLEEQGIVWDEFPADQKFGRLIQKETYAKPVEFYDPRIKEVVCKVVDGTRWATKPAVVFSEDKEFLNSIIPDKPENN